MRDLNNFLQDKSKKYADRNKKENPYEKVWEFCELWTHREIEILRHKITKKNIVNLKVKKW